MFRYTGFTDEAGRELGVQIDTLKEVGWSSSELRLVGQKHVCDMTDAEWGEVWERLQAAGIGVSCFGGQIGNWARPITNDFQVDIDELTRVAPRMLKAGTSLLRIMSYPNAKDSPWPDDAWKKEVFRRLRELAVRAEDLGVILAHENCSGYASTGPMQYREMIETVNSPALKMIFDSGNNGLHDNDHEASWRYYEACKEQVVHVHIKCAKPGPEGKLVTCFPDEDPIQSRLLGDLKRRGYRGWVSIEPHINAAIHLGKSADDTGAPRQVWVEFARRLERVAAGV